MNPTNVARCWRALIVALGLTMPGLGATAFGAVSQTPVPTPVVTRAPSVAKPWSTTTLDIAGLGYVEEEYLIEGTARAYVPTGNLAQVTNGQWDAAPTGPTAPYKTRLLVARPSDPAKFNGTVIVEWFNVSAQRDGGMFTSLGTWFTRQGYAYVGVSAQAAGVNHLRGYNAERYGTLAHPGDTHSYDIFSQALQALKAGSLSPLGDLRGRVRALVGWGGSQSAGRLITYINAVQPNTRMLDAVIPFVGGSAAALAQDPLPAIPAPAGAAVMIRTDIKIPVLVQVSEREAMTAARGFHRQPDSAYFRLWEHAGTAHVSAASSRALGQQAPASTGLGCENPPPNGLNAAPIWHAMIDGMQKWLRSGRPPQSAPRVELAIPADPAQRATAVRDPATGITRGGIRLPQIAAPIATRWGERPAGMKESNSCGLYGTSDPWNGDSDPWDFGPTNISPKPEPSLRALYRDSAGYVGAVKKSADQLVSRGWLLESDVGPVLDEARAVKID